MQHSSQISLFLFFFFNDTATTEIYTLSLHDALPISPFPCRQAKRDVLGALDQALGHADARDRKSTRLNSSHSQISYAVFCLKKKKKRLLLSFTVHQSSVLPMGTSIPVRTMTHCSYGI